MQTNYLSNDYIVFSYYIDMNIQPLKCVIHDVLTQHYYHGLRDLGESCEVTLANEMYKVGLINESTQKSPSFDGIIDEVQGIIHHSLTKRFELENLCARFLLVLTKLGGDLAIASRALQEDWVNTAKAKCGLELQIGM